MTWHTVRLANGNMKCLCPRCDTLCISEFCLFCWKADRECRLFVLDVDVAQFLRSRKRDSVTAEPPR